MVVTYPARYGPLADIWADAPSLLSAVLNSCILHNSLLRAKQTHSLILTSGGSRHRFVLNHLLNAYFKLGDMNSAGMLFHQIPSKNLMSWNITIGGLVRNGQLQPARKLFDEMPERTVATWNTMVSGLTDFGLREEGLELFRRMQRSGFRADEITFASLLRGCAGVGDALSGCQIHARLIKSRFQFDLRVVNSIAHMYMSCGLQMEGEGILEGIPTSTVVSFNTVITGRIQNGDSEGAVRCLHRMMLGGFLPDQITLTSVLAACSELATIGQCRQIHALGVKMGLTSFRVVRSSLVNTYSRCGFLNDSKKVFSESADSDYALWSAMIGSYAFHGCGHQAMELFERMVGEGIQPNEVTFLNLLYGCSHSGMKECGERVFKLMVNTYKLEPKLQHYTCMVDLLGRSNHLTEAEELIRSMPIKADAVIWKTLLSSCKRHHNVAMAKRLAKQLLLLDPHDSASYVLLSQMHATSRRWADSLEIRENMKENKVKKEPGVSWVEMKNVIHQFTAGDKSHPCHGLIFDFLSQLISGIKQCGYVPDPSAIFHDVDDEEKESSLLHHSEKLAVAFAIMNTPDGSPIRVLKNLRICSDCHLAINLIAKVTKREITVRDVTRFHHFQDGACSCGGFW